MSFCTNCGTPLSAAQRYCTVCGHDVMRASLLVPAPPISAAQSAQGSAGARVLVGLGATAPRQRRWSVLLRVVISIPLLIWLVLLSVASLVTTFAAWFAALVAGVVPRAMQQFLTDVLRYNAKVEAYLCLLTDRWPGLWLGARASDQVSLDIDHVHLNRAAVLFRLVLAVPSALVAGVLGVGAYFLTFVMWVSALIRGRVPQSLHEARGQVWRFTVRSTAFIQLLTPTQPFDGFFGDPPMVEGATHVDAPTPLTTTWSLSKWGKVVFVLTLLSGAYFQTQPSLLRWPFSYTIDRTAGPTFIAAINQNIVVDLANYVSASTNCVNNAAGGCPVDAATAQIDVAGQLATLHSFQTFVVEGRDEFRAYVLEVEKIELTLQQAANAPRGEDATYATLVTHEVQTLGQLYVALHRAL